MTEMEFNGDNKMMDGSDGETEMLNLPAFYTFNGGKTNTGTEEAPLILTITQNLIGQNFVHDSKSISSLYLLQWFFFSSF